LPSLAPFYKTIKLYVKFVAKNGVKEDFAIIDQSSLNSFLTLDRSFTQPGMMAMSPEALDHIEFTWNHGLINLDIFHLQELKIEKIEVIGLSSKDTNTRAKASVQQFCSQTKAIRCHH